MNPNSGLTTYLTAAEFCLRRDPRSIYQYSTDSPVDPIKAQSTPIAQVLAAIEDPTTAVGQVVLSRLEAASGKLESAVLRSGRYAVSDLQALLTMGGNSAEELKDVVASVAMYKLITRRPGPAPPETVVHDYNEAVIFLNDLSDGIRIFAFQEVEQAGLPQTRKFTPMDQLLNGQFVAQSRPLFGTRAIDRRFPYGGGGGCGWNGGIF
jgi:hypothetical protein